MLPNITYIGISVNYSAKIEGIEVGPAIIQCFLLCWTGDYPAQCEVGKFLGTGGAHPCRHDKDEGIILPYYIISFKKYKYRSSIQQWEQSIVPWKLPFPLSS